MVYQGFFCISSTHQLSLSPAGGRFAGEARPVQRDARQEGGGDGRPAT